MNDTLFKLMNWPEIEAVVYSEHDNPHNILGPHLTEDGVLIQVFMPTAKSVTVIKEDTKDEYPMELVDEGGYFAVLIQESKLFAYNLKVVYDNDTVAHLNDPYRFDSRIDALDMKRFNSGIHYEIYDKLGAHVCEIDGVKGVSFAVWAPNAVRVSVVGDFNMWDGRRHPMKRHPESGIFELFIPDMRPGDLYKYEIRIKGGAVVLKADPYANYAEVRPNTASVVWDINNYQWKDKTWIANRKKKDYKKLPMNVYEVHLGSFRKPQNEEREFYNYRELAPMLADHVLEMGYTHIEIMPIMEYPFDGSWGYQVTGYYAPTSRYGTPDDFMYFVDYMHQKGIGVILDWVPAHFPKDAHGLANFDGTCLYEHLDPRQGQHPHWGTLIYNYGRPQVSNFIIANALFWLDKYHVDGIRSDAVASMLYLDYGKNDGEWVANMYGGNENLEAIELFKHMNSIVHKRNDGTIMIAEESTAWPRVSTPVEEEGLGFDFKWNMGWMNDYIDYMKCDPLFRKGRHGELTFSMFYAYSENFVLVLSHDEVVHQKGSMLEKMPGDLRMKFANLRAAYGYMMTHPGKKLLFMGQEFGQIAEWSEAKELDWNLLEHSQHKEMQNYVKDLNALYLNHKALYEMDFNPEGFEWVNFMDSERSILVFLRKTSKEEETLLVVCNFTPVTYADYEIGVPFAGKYKEIFNSDQVIYGGEGNTNPKLIQSKAQEVDERPNSIKITVPPLGISVFTCTPSAKKASTKEKNSTKADSKKSASSKKENSKEAVKKAEAKTKAASKEAAKKVEAKTEEAVKEVAKKAEVKTEETVKEVAKKAEAKTKAASKEAAKKVEAKTEETVKEVAKKAETKTEAANKEVAKKAEAKLEAAVKEVATTLEAPSKEKGTKKQVATKEIKKEATSNKKEVNKQAVSNKEETKKLEKANTEESKKETKIEVETNQKERKKKATTSVKANKKK